MNALGPVQRRVLVALAEFRSHEFAVRRGGSLWRWATVAAVAACAHVQPRQASYHLSRCAEAELIDGSTPLALWEAAEAHARGEGSSSYPTEIPEGHWERSDPIFRMRDATISLLYHPISQVAEGPSLDESQHQPPPEPQASG